MKKIYIASSLHNIHRVRKLLDIFRSNDVMISYDWTTHGQAFEPEDLRKYGEAELDGVIDADVLFFLQPGRAGSHVELGAMLAMCKLGYSKTIIILEENPVEQKTFYHLESVNKFSNEADAIEFALQRLKS